MEKYARSIYRINRDISALEDGEDESREDDKEDISEILIETEVEKQRSLDDKDTSDFGGKDYNYSKDSIPKESEDCLHENNKTNENEMKKSIDNTEDASEYELGNENEKNKDEKQQSFDDKDASDLGGKE